MKRNPTPTEALAPYTGAEGLENYLPVLRPMLRWGLSPYALLAYGLILGRMKLSRRNGWADEEGVCYAQYSVAALARDLGASEATVKRVLAELEEAGLLRRAGRRGTVSRLYPQVPAGCLRSGQTVPGREPRTRSKPRAPRDAGDLDWLTAHYAGDLGPFEPGAGAG